MAKIRNEIVINRPAQAVWDVVRDFGGNDAWSDMLSDSRLDDDVRTCTLGDQSPARGAVLTEQLIASDDNLMRLEYCVMGAPFPVSSHNALIDVCPVDEQSATVSWTTTVIPDELAAMFSPGFDADLQTLKGLLEA